MRTLVAGLVAGIVVFVWGFVSHTVLPTRDMGLKSLPQEETVLAALRRANPEPGVYFFPGMDMTRRPTPEEQEAWTARIKAGPAGLLVYQRQGKAYTSTQIVIELLSNILAAIALAIVLAGLPPGLGVRVLAGALLGLFAWLSINVSHWNWYGFSNAFTFAELVDQVGAWLLGGATIGMMTRRRTRA